MFETMFRSRNCREEQIYTVWLTPGCPTAPTDTHRVPVHEPRPGWAEVELVGWGYLVLGAGADGGALARVRARVRARARLRAWVRWPRYAAVSCWTLRPIRDLRPPRVPARRAASARRAVAASTIRESARSSRPPRKLPAAREFPAARLPGRNPKLPAALWQLSRLLPRPHPRPRRGRKESRRGPAAGAPGNTGPAPGRRRRRGAAGRGRDWGEKGVLAGQEQKRTDLRPLARRQIAHAWP
jgi:hypothetical protein